MEEAKSLFGREAICRRLGIGKVTFYELVRLGLPVRKIGGIWVAHAENVEDFIKKYTIGEIAGGLSSN